MKSVSIAAETHRLIPTKNRIHFFANRKNPPLVADLYRPALALTTRERRLIGRLRTPGAVQRYLNRLPYNAAASPLTLRSFRGVVQHQSAHCLEAVLFTATVLEQHGYPATVMSFESVDNLDHVLFVYRNLGRWGAVARSRDPGLHGRRPVFRSAKALALSYVEPYVDLTGRITGYAVVDLAALGSYDWRLSQRNVWKVERLLLEYRHLRIQTPDKRINAWRERYQRFIERFPDAKPMFFKGQDTWGELPRRFRCVAGSGNTRRAW